MPVQLESFGEFGFGVSVGFLFRSESTGGLGAAAAGIDPVPVIVYRQLGCRSRCRFRGAGVWCQYRQDLPASRLPLLVLGSVPDRSRICPTIVAIGVPVPVLRCRFRSVFAGQYDIKN